MSTPYDQQEELEKLKRWWKTYGSALLIGIALGLAIVFGNKYWSDYRRHQAEAASALYDQLLAHVDKKAYDDARNAGKTLLEEYRSTPYAGLAALLLARLSFDAQQAEEARQQLRWALDNAVDEGTRHVARLRLGRLLVAAGEADSALALIEVKDTAGFASDYAELRGDLLAAKGDRQGAREAYTRALAAVDERSPYRSVLTMKLDDLGAEGAQ